MLEDRFTCTKCGTFLLQCPPWNQHRTGRTQAEAPHNYPFKREFLWAVVEDGATGIHLGQAWKGANNNPRGGKVWRSPSKNPLMVDPSRTNLNLFLQNRQNTVRGQCSPMSSSFSTVGREEETGKKSRRNTGTLITICTHPGSMLIALSVCIKQSSTTLRRRIEIKNLHFN